MGIRGLNALIKKSSPDCTTYNDIRKYWIYFYTQQCCHVEFLFKFFDKMVDKGNFLKSRQRHVFITIKKN